MPKRRPTEGPHVGGSYELAQHWRSVSGMLSLLRTAGRREHSGDMLRDAARKAAGTELEPLFHLWAADDLQAVGRSGEAVEVYLAALRAGEEARVADAVDVADAVREQLAVAYADAGDLDASVQTWQELASTTSAPATAAFADYQAARQMEHTGDERGAAQAYRSAASRRIEPGDEPMDLPMGSIVRESIRRIDAGREAAVEDPSVLADQLTKVLTAGRPEALASILAPSDVTFGYVGGDREWHDRTQLLDRLQEDLRSSDVRVAPDGLTGEGEKRYVTTTGWRGRWFSDEVVFLLTLEPVGWRWSGVITLPAGDGSGVVEPEEDPPQKGPEMRIAAPWPKGERFEAGGLTPYLTRQAAIAAAAVVFPFGTIAAAAMTMGFAARGCGFGPGGFYYGQGATHKGMHHYAIDFTRYRRGVPYALQVKGTPTLATSQGMVTTARGHVASGSSSTDNRVVVRHDRWGSSEFFNRRYESRYLHLDGPNKLSVSVGQFVERGSRLGLMDDTGYSAFSHLHFSLHDLDNGNASVRPSPMSGVTLGNGDAGTCVLSDNEEFVGWVLIEN